MASYWSYRVPTISPKMLHLKNGKRWPGVNLTGSVHGSGCLSLDSDKKGWKRQDFFRVSIVWILYEGTFINQYFSTAEMIEHQMDAIMKRRKYSWVLHERFCPGIRIPMCCLTMDQYPEPLDVNYTIDNPISAHAKKVCDYVWYSSAQSRSFVIVVVAFRWYHTTSPEP